MKDVAHIRAVVTAPCDLAHPHQQWLRAGRDDRAANQAAFLAADPSIPDEVIDTVMQLHDSAQHHFITRLLFDQGGGVHDTPEQALISAQAHHAEVSADG
ncbi:hypothetical protein [Natronospira sp.]|uniref:hypothetical protein n=1 Tax=Natronospira sp. TaxID=2024970 RepID=UPI0038732568